MTLHDPVPVFDADTNIEAQLVRTLLVNAGLEAFVVEDVSYVGTWPLGTLPGINKPQVWVERDNVEKACEFLNDYEWRSKDQCDGEPQEPYCYHCGEIVETADLKCAACGRSLDDSSETASDGSEAATSTVPSVAEQLTPEATPPREGLLRLRALKRPIAWVYLAILVGQLCVLLIGAIVGIVSLVMGWLR
jgi:hypothetical protein